MPPRGRRLILVVGVVLLAALPGRVSGAGPAPDPAALARLRSALAQDVAAQPAGTLSLMYRDLHSGARIAINATQRWDPASVVKLFVLAMAYHRRAQGTLDFNSTLTIPEMNVAPNARVAGSAYPPLLAGATATVGTLVGAMTTQSDNTAYNTLLDLLGRDRITAYVQQDLALTHTTVGRKLSLEGAAAAADNLRAGAAVNSTTVGDVARFYTLLYRHQVPLAANMLLLLGRQKQNMMVPAGLPPGATMAHKPGEVDDTLRHDGGIITFPNGGACVLVVFSSLGSYAELAAIGRQVAAAYPPPPSGEGAGGQPGSLASMLRLLLAVAAAGLLVLVAGLDRGLVGSRPRGP